MMGGLDPDVQSLNEKWRRDYVHEKLIRYISHGALYICETNPGLETIAPPLRVFTALTSSCPSFTSLDDKMVTLAMDFPLSSDKCNSCDGGKDLLLCASCGEVCF